MNEVGAWMGSGSKGSSSFMFYKLENFVKRNFQWPFSSEEVFHWQPLLLPFFNWEMFMKPNFRAPERNEDVRSCLRSLCVWQTRGNCIWARTANSDPNKIQVYLTAQKIIGQYCWKFPHRTYKFPLHSCGIDPGKYEMGQHTQRRTQKCVWPSHLQDLFYFQQYTDFSPTKQLTNIPEQVQALSPATGRKVKSMSTPGGIKFDLVSFSKHAKTWVQAGYECWIRPVHGLLSQGKCWAQQATYSWSSITIYFMDQKIRYHFWRFLKVKRLWRKMVIFQWKSMQLKTMGVFLLLRLGAICFSPSFLQKIPLVTYIPSYWEAGRCPECSPTSRAAPTSLPSVGLVLLLWLLSRGRFVRWTELWASCPAAASASGALL